MTSPVKAGTMVKANLLPAHLVTLTVTADTARSGVGRERTVANASKTSSAALLVLLQQILLSSRTHSRVKPRALHLLDPADDDTSWIFVLSAGAHDLARGRGGSITIRL